MNRDQALRAVRKEGPSFGVPSEAKIESAEKCYVELAEEVANQGTLVRDVKAWVIVLELAPNHLMELVLDDKTGRVLRMDKTQ